MLRKLLLLKFSIRFFLPKKSNIIIFDEEGSNEIKEYILKNQENYILYDHNKIIIYINLKFIYYYLKNITTHWNTQRSIMHNLYIIYISTEIKLINPIIIITYNDDNIIYHSLIRTIKNIKFIAIQNGLREKFVKERIKHDINHDQYFSFGSLDEDKQSSYEWTFNHITPIGSLRAGIALNLFRNLKKKHQIAYVSEFSENNDNHSSVSDEQLFSRQTDQYIANYHKNNPDLKIIIILRSNKYSEKKYFRSIFGSQISFSKPSEYLDSYRTIIESDLVIGFCSTLLIEALALSTKTLSIDSSNSDKYFYFDDELRYKFRNPKDLSNKINSLLDMSYDDYKSSIKKYLPLLMNIDKKSLPHNEISKFINCIIN